ncbi:uncharacterized protein KY384_006599 [Bacidia gigantensis]|uniref:uncharacterized protein n=1 Tax=Bacidia gigantensis TaxID=2732470 RepID=UPI001D05347C|nr:uncharacterized protein KY384_006599 [Bacidia gigantensis]KAG8528910.1 hypothetical protein KY384_006599 [Bacidia gigantensis]
MAALPIRHVPKPSSSQTSHSTLKPGPLSPTFLLSTTPSSDAKDITSLRLHATYIRDTLVPLLSSDRDLPIQEAILLRNILSKISRISPIATDMLRQTRIERALKIIATSGSPWPADTVRQAKVILRRWEKEVGFPLDSIRADLFGRGGRLEGLAPAFQPVAPGDQFVIRDVVSTLSTLYQRVV